jgi:hypothetical protein
MSWTCTLEKGGDCILTKPEGGNTMKIKVDNPMFDILPLLQGMIPALHKGIRAQDSVHFLKEFNAFIKDSGYIMGLTDDGFRVVRCDGNPIEEEQPQEYDIDVVWAMIEQAQRWLRDLCVFRCSSELARRREDAIHGCRQSLIGAWKMLKNLRD